MGNTPIDSLFQFQHGTIKSRLISLYKYQQIRGYFNYKTRLLLRFCRRSAII